MLKLRLTVLLSLTIAQVTVGSLIATLVVSNVAAAASLPASHTILAGPGYTDVSPHQIVRTGSNILYTIAPTCDAYPSCPGNSLRVYRADQSGTPASFSEQDAAHRPTDVGSSAIALDGTDTIHVLWNDRTGMVNYRTFDTTANRWSATTAIATTNWTDFGQGDEGVALAVDGNGTPHAAWSAKAADGVLHIFYANRAANWIPRQIDDVPLTTNRRTLHPTLAFKPDSTLLLAWLEGTFNYVPDGTIHIRARSPADTWSATQTIADPDGAMTTIDNGPSLLVTPDGTAHLAFLAANPPDQIRYWYDPGTGWLGDRQPPNQITHDPSLGPDGAGGIFIYGHGTPVPFDGHGDNLYSFHKPAAGAWGPWTLYATGSFDSSVSTRSAQFFHPFPQTLDLAFWGDAYPNTLYVGTDTAISTTAARLAVAGFPSPTTAGTSQSFTVMAQDGSGNPVPTYTGTIHFASTDLLATLPNDYMFTGADAGTHTFTATLATAGAQSVAASDTANTLITGSISVTVSPAAAARFVIAGFPTTISSSRSGSFTVTAEDVFGNTAVGYAGMIHFTSSDAQALLPADGGLIGGTGMFAATLRTAGSQSLTARDIAVPSITGSATSTVVICGPTRKLVRCYAAG